MIKKIILCNVLLVAAGYGQAQTYTYDELGRVKNVTQGDRTTTYTYDAADNRTSTVTTGPGGGGSSSNSAPTCSSTTVNMGSIPTFAGPVSVQLTAANFISKCSDSDGDTLTLISPSAPYSFTVASGQTVNITYKVSDGTAADVSATFTYKRP